MGVDDGGGEGVANAKDREKEKGNSLKETWGCGDVVWEEGVGEGKRQVVDERIGEKEKKKKEKQKGKKEEEKEKEKAAEEKEKIFPYRIVGMIEMIDTWLAKMYRVGEKEKEKEKEKDKNQKEKEKKTVKNRDFLRDEWKKRNYFGMFGMVEERKNRKKEN